MDYSDSENEDFVSADEFESDEGSEQHAKVVKSCDEVKSEPVCVLPPEPSETKERIVVKEGHDSEEDIGNIQSRELRSQIQNPDSTGDDDEEEQVEVRSYRKRPERPKKVTAAFSKPMRPELNPIVDIVKVARPDAIINDLKSHLTSNLSKGFATFQETSSSLKGLVMGVSNALDNVKKESSPFVYDDDRTKHYEEVSCDDSTEEIEDEAVQEPRSAISDEILKLSNAFAKLNEASILAATKDKAREAEQLESFLETNVLQEIQQMSLENLQAESENKSAPQNMTVKPQYCDKKEDKAQTLAENVVKHSADNVQEVNAPTLIVDVTNSVAVDDSNEFDGCDSTNTKRPLGTTNEMVLPGEASRSTDIESNADTDKTFAINPVAVEGVATSSREEIQPDVEVTSSPAIDGWDDWSSENEEHGGTPPEGAKNIDPELTCVVRKEENEDEGWGDWGDDDSKETIEVDKKNEKIREETADDGWGDWGDDDFIDVAANTKTETVPAEKRPVGSLALKTSQQQEWSGWNSFGQKKDKEWGIGGWGINTLLTTATAVTSNLSAVIESGLGVPDPQTFARMQKEESEKEASGKLPCKDEVKPKEETSQFAFRHIVAGVGKIVEVAKVQEISSRVLSGGLDTLETIGKKTMEVLQEGDPGLKKKRALLLGQGQQLSLVLKEARDRAAADDRRAGELAAGRRRHFETVFDDFQGRCSCLYLL